MLLATSLIPLPISNSKISVPSLWHGKNTKERTILHTAATYIIVYIPGKHLIHQDTPSAIQKKRKRFKGILIWQGRCRVICYFGFKGRDTITVNFLQQRTEGIFFSKTGVYKCSIRFQVSCLLSNWVILKAKAGWQFAEVAFCFLTKSTVAKNAIL